MYPKNFVKVFILKVYFLLQKLNFFYVNTQQHDCLPYSLKNSKLEKIIRNTTNDCRRKIKSNQKYIEFSFSSHYYMYNHRIETKQLLS